MGGRLKSPGLGGVKPSALVTDVATELTVSPVSAAVLLLVCGRWSESGPGHVDPEHCTEQDTDRHEVRRAQPAIQSPAERSLDEHTGGDVADCVPRGALWFAGSRSEERREGKECVST